MRQVKRCRPYASAHKPINNRGAEMNADTQQGDWVTEAERRRDIGIERASAHAEDESPGWNDRAYRLLLEYILIKRGASFLAEEFRLWAESRIEAPPDPRTWGKPIQAAAYKHLITRVGFAKANTSNRSPKALWMRADRNE